MRATDRGWRALRSPQALLVAAGLIAAGAVTALPTAAQARSDRTTDIQVLAINDLHGNLEPPQGSSGTVPTANGPVVAGGVEYLATHLREARARQGNRNTVTVGAGDLIGASPLISGAFHDEPTAQVLDRLGLDVSSVGNHEFDEGKAELRRIQRGGCHPEDGCTDRKRPYQGAKFRYLAGNAIDTKSGRPLLPPYWVKDFRGARVGFIGLTLEGTPGVTSPAGAKGLKFLDEVETANRYARLLRKQHVEAIVLLLHEGGFPAGANYDANCDSPGPGAGISGPIVDIAKKLDASVDAVVTGHTHQPYVCTVPDPSGQPRLVTSAASYGRLFTELHLTYDARTRDIRRTSAESATGRNVIVTRDVAKDPAVSKLVTKYQKLVAPIANRVVGHISGDVLGRGASTPETPLGDLISDGQRELTGAQLAFMNPGGVRGDLTFKASGAEGDGVVTYGEAFNIQPFGNILVTQDMTGEKILQVLRQQYSGANEANPKVLQPSGITYTVDRSRKGADRILAETVKIGGVPLDATRTYKVVVNEFLASGGDNFPALKEAGNVVRGAADLEALEKYLTAHSSKEKPLAPPAVGRITFQG